jgi:hypothetical protein
MVEVSDVENVVGHTLAGVAVVTTLVGALPKVAAAFTILWYGIAIYESKTFQKILGKVRSWNRTKK